MGGLFSINQWHYAIPILTAYVAGQLKYPYTVKELVEKIAKRFELNTDIKWDKL